MKYTDTTTPKILAYMITLGVFSLVALLTLATIPDDNKPLISNIIVTVLTVWVGAMGYFLGTSSGSATKTSMMANEPVAALVAPAPPVV